MTPRPRVMKRNIALAEKISNENGGKLPNPWKLINMGYGGLYIYIKRHPEAFKDFTYARVVGVDNKRQTTFSVTVRDDHIKIATQLAQKHKKLPDFSWLNAHGYSRLAAYIRAYPEVFKQISTERTLKKKKKCSRY